MSTETIAETKEADEQEALATAGLLRRTFAAVLDNVVFSPLMAVLFAAPVAHLLRLPEPEMSSLWWRTLLYNLTLFVYSAAMLARFGRTLGMMALRLRVTTSEGRALEPGRAVLRTFVYALPVLAFAAASRLGWWLVYGVAEAAWGIGVAWIVVDQRHQGYHDKIAKTLVVVARRARRADRPAEAAAEGQP